MKYTKRLLICFLALWMMAMPVISALSVDAEGEYIRYEILSSSALLSLLDGENHSEAEQRFLDRYGDGETIYNAALPGELISLSAGIAEAEGYATLTLSGTPILWTPDGAVRLREAEGIAEADYGGAMTVSRAEANRLLNFAYNEALLANGAQTEIRAYEEDLVRYQTYQTLLAKYQSDLIAYNRYLEDKAEYDRELAAYLANQNEWTAYGQKLAAYNQYVTEKERYGEELAAYKTEKAAYDKARMEYDSITYPAYLKNQQKIATVMEPMESMFIRYGTWDGSAYGLSSTMNVGTLYQALQNEDLVSMLMEYKDRICSATSLQPATFDSLKATSDELNEILRQYAAKREESTAEAFAFYTAHYTEIRDKFNHLYDEMTRILKPSVYSLMCAYLNTEYGDMAPYKKWRIKNVLCQIYMVSQCIDDTSTRTVTWSFFADDGDPGEYYYSSFLNQSQILTDLNGSDPGALRWQEEPAEPVAPVAPVEPTFVPRPSQPLERLSEPTAPAAVANPVEPTPVAPPTAPARERYELVAKCADILAQWQSGELVWRTEFSADVTVTLRQTLCRRYDPATGEPTESVYGETGALVDDREDVAEEWNGPHATYVLLGFRTSADGLCHYPIYETEDRVFQVIFRSEGREIHRQDYAYGQTPAPTLIPQKEPTQTLVYEFESWEPALSPVREDTVYDAKFTERERQYTVIFRMKEGDVLRYHRWQDTPEAPTPQSQYREGVYLYRFVGWDREIVAVSGDALYNAVYARTVLVETPGEDPDDPSDPPDSSETESGSDTDEETETGGGASDESSGGGINLEQNQNGYVVETDGSRLQIGALLELCQGQNKGLTFLFTEYGIKLELNRAAVASLHTEGATQIAFLSTVFTAGKGVGVTFYGAEGETIQPVGTVRLSLPAEGSGGRLYVRQYSADGSRTDWDDVEETDGAVLVDMEGGSTYELIRKYTLTVKTLEGGTVSLDHFLFEEGEQIPVTVYPKAGYRLGTLSIENPVTGEIFTFASVEELVMPDFDGTLTVAFTERMVTVEFRYHGGSQIFQYRMGDTVIPPEIPISFVEDGTFYTFIGWSKNIEAATEDTVYEATYQTAPESEVPGDGEGGAMGGVLRYWILPAVGIVLGVGAVITAGVIVGVKLTKKRKSKNSKKE